MKAALSLESTAETPNLSKWLHHCTSAVLRLNQEGPLDRTLKVHDQPSQVNVLVQLEHLMSYSLVHERVRAGKLQLSGWWLNIANGDMFSYERETRAFERMDRAAAERLIARLDRHG